MHVVLVALLLFGAYLFGSIPCGLVVVRLINGRDLRTVESGRTGGTNAMRAAGPWAGVLTGALDISKAAATVFLARALTPDAWVHTLTATAAILGHNYSIFMAERGPDRRLRLRGGAGGSAAGGGAVGLWPPILLILLPLAGLVWYGIGYASVTTMSIALIAILVFAVRAALGLSPWQYVIYGALAEILLLIALRPNIRRLLNGTERLHGWRSRQAGQKQPGGLASK